MLRMDVSGHILKVGNFSLGASCMSRLPGGVFVGVVTLMCGLMFTQLEDGTQEKALSVESIPANSLPEELKPTESKEMQVEMQQQVASDERSKS
jgi:hypothetical protein